MFELSRFEWILLKYSVIIRIWFCFSIIVFSFFPDHEADAFKPPSSPTISSLDLIVRVFFDGFKKWDSVYFTFIAQYGYVFEQSLAFFPFMPLILGTAGRLLRCLSAFCLSLESSILISGVCTNFLVNIVSTVLLFRVGVQLLNSEKVSFFAALLFCVNPATVFFSSLYSESLFFFFTILGLYFLLKGKFMLSSVLFGVSVFCRSNGLLNAGYITYFLLMQLDLRHFLWSEETINKSKQSIFFFLSTTIKWWCYVFVYVIPRLSYVVLCVTPYFLYQAYCYFLYCSMNSVWLFVTSLPQSVIAFGASSGFILPLSIAVNSSSLEYAYPDWCYNYPPLSYSHIQRKYWSVGLLQYYTLRQIPNFALTCPVIVICLGCASAFYCRAPKAYKTLGLYAESITDRKLVPFVFHLLFLCIYGVGHINVQVITRMLFSSCPVVYWYCAYICGDAVSRLDLLANCYRQGSYAAVGFLKTLKYDIRMIIHILNPFRQNSFKSSLILFYFFTYGLVGCFMHSNFLPWT